MSLESQNNDNQEIDLSQVSKKIGSFFTIISEKIFLAILFIKRKFLWLSIIVLFGFAAGYFLDKKIKSYDNKLIVHPNFGSNDYLYAKIDLLNSKISDGDTLFLKNVVGIKKPKKLGKIEIKPILDVYKFIERKDKDNNFELLKLMAEDGDIKKIVTEDLTSKNYPYHEIIFKTAKKISTEDVVKPLLSYLNDSEYFKTIQKQYIENIEYKIQENDSIIGQIDNILSNFSKSTKDNQKSDKLVYYNENSQLGDVLKTKNELIYELLDKKIDLKNLDKIIKLNSESLNLKNTTSINGKLKFLLPILLIFFYLITLSFISFYKKQLQKFNK